MKSFVAQLGLGLVVDDEAEAGARVVAGRRVGACPRDAVPAHHAHGVVVAVDADAVRAADGVALDPAHRHLVHRDRPQARLLDVVVAQHAGGRVEEDPLLAADDPAALDQALAVAGAERDVDALAEEGVAHVDRAVPDRDRGVADVDAVERRTFHGDAVERDVPITVHGDPVLAPDDAHVADRHVRVPHDDPPDDHRRVAPDEVLAPIDDQRAARDAGREVDDGREVRPPDRSGGGEGHGDRGADGEPCPAELASILCVRQPPERQQPVAENLRRDPACGEQGERDGDRGLHAESEDGRHDRAELEQPERHSSPAGLVGEQRVVGEVEREQGRDHRARELHRPPASQGGREHDGGQQRRQERREPRLEPASQRVRHLRRKAWAAKRAPASVSAAG